MAKYGFGVMLYFISGSIKRPMVFMYQFALLNILHPLCTQTVNSGFVSRQNAIFLVIHMSNRMQY